MKLTRLAVTPNGKITAIIVTANDGNPPELITRPLTLDETRRVAEVYNAVADVAEGSNHLPYQMTFQLLKDEDIVDAVIESMEPELDRHIAS